MFDLIVVIHYTSICQSVLELILNPETPLMSLLSLCVNGGILRIIIVVETHSYDIMQIVSQGFYVNACFLNEGFMHSSSKCIHPGLVCLLRDDVDASVF